MVQGQYIVGLRCSARGIGQGKRTNHATAVYRFRFVRRPSEGVSSDCCSWGCSWSCSCSSSCSCSVEPRLATGRLRVKSGSKPVIAGSIGFCACASSARMGERRNECCRQVGGRNVVGSQSRRPPTAELRPSGSLPFVLRPNLPHMLTLRRLMSERLIAYVTSSGPECLVQH